MTLRYKKGEKIFCPECGELQDDFVEDYVIPGEVGSASITEEECYECSRHFQVEYLGNGEFAVHEI